MYTSYTHKSRMYVWVCMFVFVFERQRGTHERARERERKRKRQRCIISSLTSVEILGTIDLWCVCERESEREIHSH